jgi:hypothetical protein
MNRIKLAQDKNPSTDLVLILDTSEVVNPELLT